MNSRLSAAVLLWVLSAPFLEAYTDWTPWFSGLASEARSPQLRETEASSGPEGLVLAPITVLSEYSARPFADWGDGAAWRGVGWNGSLQGGLVWNSDWLQIWLEPELWYAQNQEPELPPTGNPPFGDAHRGGWDHPTRMGLLPLQKYGWGQSRISVDVGPLEVEVGTASRIWGDSRYNSLLLSANGPGVPSVEFSLNPVDTSLGTFEGHYLAGRLLPSGYQAESGLSGERLWTGLFLAYSPRFQPNLTLSAARTALSSLDAFDRLDLLVPFLAKYKWGIDKYDQRFSLSYRWRFPAESLEVYGEWGRNDYSPRLSAWMQDLERTQAYVFGLRKGFPLPLGILAFEGELVAASLGPEALINANGYFPNGVDFYTHGILREGYTIEGQDLGAAVGNGNALSLSGVWIDRDVALKAELRRWVKDYSVLVATLDRTGETKINVQYETDLEGRVKLGGVTWILGYTSVYEISPYFQAEKNVHSIRARLGLEFRP